MLQLLLKRGSRIDVQDKVRILICYHFYIRFSHSVQLAGDRQFRTGCTGDEKECAVELVL